MNEATAEIQRYCDENKWISDIKSYTSKYSSKLVMTWKPLGSHEIDEQLSKIKAWVEMIKTSIESQIITKNKLFKIDCRPVEAILVPKLETIYNDICECILKEISADLNGFIKLITTVLKVWNNIILIK